MKESILLYPIILISISLPFQPAQSSEVKFWTESERGHLEKGTHQGISFPGSGGMMLSPRVKPLGETTLPDGLSPFFWCQVVDSAGNIFVGSGNDGIIYKITKEGKVSIFFKADESEVTALAMDDNEDIYAGTSPMGKIYRITKSGNHEIFSEPQERYIWSLAFHPRGNLFAATGERGLILNISKNGEYQVFFDSDESHIVSLAIDGDGNLLAGSDRKGILYKISLEGTANVLLASDRSEVSSITIGQDGTVYASMISHLELEPPSPPLLFKLQELIPASEFERKVAESTMEETPGKKFTAVVEGFPLPEKKRGPERPRSVIHAISRGVDARPLLKLDHENIYTLCAGKDGRIYFGTGEPGRIYRLEEDGRATLLFKLPEAQVISIIPSRNSGLSMVTSNMGKAYHLSQELESSGTFVSRPFDTGMRSEWGKMRCSVEQKDGTRIEIYTRSGNTETPDSGWSEWSRSMNPLAPGKIESPPARFVQWKAHLSRIDPGKSPILYSVTIPYLQFNAAPEIGSLSILKAGQFLEAEQEPPPGSSSEKGKRKIERGEKGISWQASDPNGDSILFTIFFRPETRDDWTKLDEVRGKNFYLWNHSGVPDGLYRIKVRADDSPSNFAGEERFFEIQSEPFTVDGTPPEMKIVRKSVEGQRLFIDLHVEDATGKVQKVLYSIDRKDWSLAKPEDRICDSPEETFSFSVDLKESDRVYLKCLDDSMNESSLEITR
ncbi:MAG: hypothetical protein AB1756_05210 [Acidobacteriota bacterium]